MEIVITALMDKDGYKHPVQIAGPQNQHGLFPVTALKTEPFLDPAHGGGWAPTIHGNVARRRLSDIRVNGIPAWVWLQTRRRDRANLTHVSIKYSTPQREKERS